MKIQSRIAAGILAAGLMLSLCACNTPAASTPEAPVSPAASQPPVSSGQEAAPEKSEGAVEEMAFTPMANLFPEELAEIPAGYFSPAAKQGTLVELSYQTWESMSYEQQSRQLQKRAIVYLPYGYDENQSYNIFYWMHGGWSNETTNLGTPESPSAFKNVLDHGIETGEIQPLIIVCPTYNNLSGSDSGDYSLAIQLTRNYHNELINDLIPAVESRYSTYAQSTSPEDLIASRDHRGFGGFSMGSVATWRTFEYCLDYFRYFLPMSGSAGGSGKEMDEAVKRSGRPWNDFFIVTITGTADFAASAFERQVRSMQEYTDSFRYGDNEEDSNLTYRIKEGYSHDGTAVSEYVYNGLRWFWNHAPSSPISGTALYTADTPIADVMADPAFGDYGRLIFPANTGYWSGNTLGELRLTWYSHIDPDKTVEIANYMKAQDEAGETIFYDIYTEEEKAADPSKRDTGLFFFRGEPGARFAVCNAGGGFAYVGAMHDTFPHALELSKKGYNAFALIYRPGAQTACEDLARAISFIFAHKEKLQVDTGCYSLWGGSAGGRMAAYLGAYGPAGFGGDDLPRPGAAIIQYTGHSEYSRNDPPTYSCVGENDGIASWRTMEQRLERLSALGTDTEFHVYPGLGHGFGLGTGTAAEGWLDDAVAFWEKQMKG